MQTVWLAQGPVRAAQWGLIAAQPDVVWIEQWQTWLPEFAARGSRTRLLTTRQQLAVWQTVIESSDSASQLLDSRSVAQWASEAWSLLRQYRVTDPWLHGGGSDLSRLLDWGDAFKGVLAERGWRTRDELLASLQQLSDEGMLQHSPRHLVLLDITELTPLEQACLDLLAAAGWQIEHRPAPRIETSVNVRCTAAPADELESALEWLLRKLESDPDQKLALVVPRSASMEGVLRRRFAQRNDVGFASGRTPLEFPPVAAALNALDMLGPSGGANELSAWLRSPFMHGPAPADLGDAARCELAERESIAAQLPVIRQQKALIERLSQRAPDAAERLDAAFAPGNAADSVTSLAQWTRLWRAQLQALGWMRHWQPGERDRAVQMLERGFDSVVMLAPVLGAIDARRALAEIRATLSEPLIGSRLPVAGLHVLDDVDDLGPGYAAAWVAGMNHDEWPRRARPNPLLPRRLQKELRMPWAEAQYGRRQAEKSLERLVSAVPEVVLSWSEIRAGEETGPAAVLAPWLDDRARLTGVESPAQRMDEDSALGEAELETVSDSPGLMSSDSRLSGGATLLNLQAACPLRAFIDYRLHARELPRRSRGISRALRGQILHRAAARLMRPGTRSEGLADGSVHDWSERISAAADHALRYEFQNNQDWFAELIRFERRRVELTLMKLLEAESGRGAFSVAAVEDEVSLLASDVSLRARIDRMDRLEAGGFAIVDYKTGTTGTTPRWFDEGHADFQMPLYAVAAENDVTALVICSLSPERVEYRGFWMDESAFPRNSLRNLDSTQWSRQLAHWQKEIDGLIADFVAGDEAVYAENVAMALGMYAPLTRLAEVLATLTNETSA